MLRYWGEIPISSSQTNRSSFDLLPREFRLVEVHDPPLHQPSANKPKPPTMLDIPSEPCSLTIHTIQLIQHNRRLRNLIATAQAQSQQQTEGVKTEESEPLPSCPGSPPLPDDLLPIDCKNPNAPFQIRHSDPESDFYRLTLACQQISKQLSEEYERIVNPEKATEDTKPVKIKEEPVSDITFPVSEELEADLASGDQSLPMGVLGAQSERFPSNLEVEASPQASSTEVNASPLWNLAHVKMEPQESEEGNVSGHGVLGSDVFEEPMSGMSEAGIPQSPDDSDSSYGSHSTDSLMGSSPVFNQRCKKRMRKI
uniref:SPT7 like, STAGA complex subunit gamma n=2 Tax=Canis lupus familiaris TaxID=9615 RepID=A0A8P0SQ97_CANLF